MEFSGIKSINGDVKIPGDKSISHRSVIISSLTDKSVRIKNFLFSEDCICTIETLRKLGVRIEINDDEVVVYGAGIHGLKEPDSILEVGNSGTTIRLVSGIIAGNNILSVLSGDNSVNNRPMARIIEPLNEMGAEVYGRSNNKKAPIIIFGSNNLKGKRFELNVSSAQVKSCITLAGLHAEGTTEISQPQVSRDHTERMLEYFESDIEYNGRYTRINPKKKLAAKDLAIPGDISSALFLIVAAIILKDSHIIIRDIGINPTRSYIIDVLKNMGGLINIRNKRTICNEPVGDIEAGSSDLSPVNIDTDKISYIIDEIPALCVAASKADGTTVIKGAGELRYKESDRIEAIVRQFKKAGIDIKGLKDGLVIKGDKNLKIKGCSLDSLGDHRIAMSLSLLSMLSDEKVCISGTNCINTSFPGFENIFKNIS
jgi:3-phosphoshikimate 1-carboxyvinyltransferase